MSDIENVNSPSDGVIANVIYVGVDGSSWAAEAAMWAADNAHRRHAALCLVHGYLVAMVGLDGGVVYPSEIYDAEREWQNAMLESTRSTLIKAYPGLEVGLLLRYGSPVEILRSESAHALMTVVGSHGAHQFLDSVLGSIAAATVTHGIGPVVVVRSDPKLGAVRTAGPIAVALDGFPDSDEALAFAFQEASLRGRALIALHTWDDAALDGFSYAAPMPVDRSIIDDEERRLLAEQLAGWVDKYPDVAVTSLVLRGSPVAALLEYSVGDDDRPALLVVGSRGRGGFAGLLLGSTSQALIAHAPCPVAVVRGQEVTSG